MLVFHRRNSQDRPLMALTDAQCSLLDFERTWWQAPVSKTEQIRSRFGFSSSSYYRALYALVDLSDAVAYDPLTVRRVRRRREQSRRERIEGRRADPGSR
jgi:hypothetical protein